MIRRIREKISIFVAKSPKKAVLIGIMLFNATFMMIAAAIITALSKRMSGIAECGYWEALYRTITMILDAGCIDNIIQDVGKAGAFAAIVCIVVVILGMVFFTGAVIGYVTNVISDFIDSKNNGKNKLLISDHVVIINWNARGAEIVNEFLYTQKRLILVVFIPEGRDEVREEIRNRLDTSLLKDKRLKDNITCIVREGDVAAATDLDDICISKARTVIILDNEGRNKENGNTQTIKTLIQVSEISKGNKDQKIIVEVADDWTEDLVYRIMAFNSEGKSETIVPVLYKYLLGLTYARIAINPELAEKSDELFNDEFKYKGRNIVVIGHNSNMDSLMACLDLCKEDIKVFMFDDEESLKEHNYYEEYPYVNTLSANIYDEETLQKNIIGAAKYALDDTSIMILSDDSVENEDVDANALTYLIYIQEMIRRMTVEDPNFRRDKLEVLVEVLNPKNEEIVKNYGADRVISCNKYVSHLISQMSK